MVWVLLGTLGGLGGFFLPNILGSLKDIIGTYSPGFIVFALIAVAATFILLFVNSMLWKKEDWKETMPITRWGSRTKKTFIPQSAVRI